MSAIERVRVVWLFGTGLGVVLVIMNLREAMVDLLALNESPRATIAVLQIQARGTVWDQALKTVAMCAMLAIGFVSRPHQRRSGVPYLFSVGFMLVNGACLVTLSWMQNRRRHLISQALRLRRKDHPEA